MAVLAGKSQIAVRAVRAFRGLRSRASRECGKHKRQDDSQSGWNPSAHDLHLAFVLVTESSECECLANSYGVSPVIRLAGFSFQLGAVFETEAAVQLTPLSRNGN